MSQALILRDRSIQLTPEERACASRALEKGLRGVDEPNHKRWRLFLKKLFSMEDGEIAEISTRMPRSGPFHRYHMALEQAVFDAQDRFDQFEMFRNWVKIGAGHVEWVPGAKGGIVPLPKSISYAQMEEPAMREFHANVMAFFRGPHAAKYLWKHLGDKSFDMMESVLDGFTK